MHFLLPLLILFAQLAPLTLARPTQTVIACLSFTGSVTTQTTLTINGSTIEQPYTVTGRLLSSSSANPANASTLAVVCTYNATLQNFFIGVAMDCVAGYTAHFWWGMRQVSYTTPNITSFLGTDPAFAVNASLRSDGSATDFEGVFGCDGGNDTVTAWYNWGGF